MLALPRACDMDALSVICELMNHVQEGDNKYVMLSLTVKAEGDVLREFCSTRCASDWLGASRLTIDQIYYTNGPKVYRRCWLCNGVL